jgi:hypothetical protein
MPKIGYHGVSSAMKSQIASLDVEDVKRMKRRIHEMSFLKKEQERQMEVMSVLDRNSLNVNRIPASSVLGKGTKK